MYLRYICTNVWHFVETVGFQTEQDFRHPECMRSVAQFHLIAQYRSKQQQIHTSGQRRNQRGRRLEGCALEHCWWRWVRDRHRAEHAARIANIIPKFGRSKWTHTCSRLERIINERHFLNPIMLILLSLFELLLWASYRTQYLLRQHSLLHAIPTTPSE